MMNNQVRQPNPALSAWERERPHIRKWFEENFYGKAPLGRPKDQVFSGDDISFAAGRITIHLQVRIPDCATPDNPAAVFVFGDHAKLNSGNFYPNVPEDEILKRGHAFIRYDMNEIVPDRKAGDPKLIDGVFKEYGGWDKPDGWGRIAAWAWGYSRIVDWIEAQPRLDASRIAVAGHSRGGKTALWAAAQDERIFMAVSNDSGTGGAHLNSIVTPGCEKVDAFVKATSYNFFCPNFLKLAGHETELQHDADDLLRLIAPRRVYIASALLDAGAGPQGEFEAAKRASSTWRDLYSLPGLSLLSYPEKPTSDHSGHVGYHIRDGYHDFKTSDWIQVLDYFDTIPGNQA